MSSAPCCPQSVFCASSGIFCTRRSFIDVTSKASTFFDFHAFYSTAQNLLNVNFLFLLLIKDIWMVVTIPGSRDDSVNDANTNDRATILETPNLGFLTLPHYSKLMSIPSWAAAASFNSRFYAYMASTSCSLQRHHVRAPDDFRHRVTLRDGTSVTGFCDLTENSGQ